MTDRAEGSRGTRDRLRIAAGAVIAAIALAALGDLWRRGLPAWDETGPGPAFFPLVLALTLLVLGVIFALTSDPPREAAESDESFLRPPTVKFVILLVGLILLFPRLGGLIALSLFVAVEMWWVERAPLKVAILSGVAAFAIIWFLFVWILAVPLPLGFLPESFG